MTRSTNHFNHRGGAAAVAAAATAMFALTVPMAARADVQQQIAGNKSLATFNSTLQSAEYGPRLKEAGTVTIFAPSDEAFAKLPATVRERLLAPEGRGLLNTILSYHVVTGNLKAADVQAQLKDGSATLTPLGGGTLLTVKGTGPTDLTVNGARIVTADASTDAGGTVHVIDTVLIPAPLLTRLGLPPVGASVAGTAGDAGTAGGTGVAGAVGGTSAGAAGTGGTTGGATAGSTTGGAGSAGTTGGTTAGGTTGTAGASTGTAVGVGTASSSAAPPSKAQDAIPTTPPGATATPPAGARVPGTGVSVVQGEPEFATLARLIGAAGLVEELSKPGPFTILAPTNAAFEKLPQGTVENLLKPENKQQLVAILRNHVVAGNYTSADVAQLGAGENAQVKSAGGGTLKVTVANGTATVNGAKVTKPDIKASNGVIHQIDAVLLPAAGDASGAGGTGTSGSNATGSSTGTGSGTGNSGGGTTPAPANPPANP